MNFKKDVPVSFDLLEDFMKDAFAGYGVPEEDAEICAKILIESDKRGIDSHGVGRFKPIYLDRLKAKTQLPKTDFQVVKEGPTSAVVDGGNGMGLVVGYKCMCLALKKARTYGMSMVTARNSNHYGIAGYYGLMAIGEGMIGITGTNARPSIAPTFGVENMLGTNPLTFGIPTDEEFPFVIDCATSITQRGKIEVYDRLNKELPAGWVIDQEGNTRTDTKQVLKDLTSGTAALTPLGGPGEDLGGYKGYGYATVVEMLSSALQGGAFLKALSGMDADGNKQPYNLGHFFMAIDITQFTDLNSFKKTTGEICRELRNSKKAPGAERIYTAGEKEYLAYQHRIANGGVPMDDVLMQQLVAVRDELNLKQYKFPFEN